MPGILKKYLETVSIDISVLAGTVSVFVIVASRDSVIGSRS